MSDLTLQDVARRLADLESKVAALSGKPVHKDWRRTVGCSRGANSWPRLMPKCSPREKRNEKRLEREH
jgi:hypothetical protein